jgi:hypothetical protein
MGWRLPAGALALAMSAAFAAELTLQGAAVGDETAAPAGRALLQPPDGPDASTDASGVPESVEQFVYRRRYVALTVARLQKAIILRHRGLSSREKEVVRKHWRVALRLLRLRDVAQDEGDLAATRRVEAALTLADRRLFDALEVPNTEVGPDGGGS